LSVEDLRIILAVILGVRKDNHSEIARIGGNKGKRKDQDDSQKNQFGQSNAHIVKMCLEQHDYLRTGGGRKGRTLSLPDIRVLRAQRCREALFMR
jgi:hypothetical protein